MWEQRLGSQSIAWSSCEPAVGDTGVSATDTHQLLSRCVEKGQETWLCPLGLVSSNPNTQWIAGTQCASLEELLISYSLLFRLNTRQQNLISQYCEIAVRENWRAAPHFQRHYEMVPVALASHFAVFVSSAALPLLFLLSTGCWFHSSPQMGRHWLTCWDKSSWLGPWGWWHEGRRRVTESSWRMYWPHCDHTQSQLTWSLNIEIENDFQSDLPQKQNYMDYNARILPVFPLGHASSNQQQNMTAMMM